MRYTASGGGWCSAGMTIFTRRACRGFLRFRDSRGEASYTRPSYLLRASIPCKSPWDRGGSGMGSPGGMKARVLFTTGVFIMRLPGRHPRPRLPRLQCWAAGIGWRSACRCGLLKGCLVCRWLWERGRCCVPDAGPSRACVRNAATTCGPRPCAARSAGGRLIAGRRGLTSRPAKGSGWFSLPFAWGYPRRAGGYILIPCL